ncbi:hypothetical protein [Spirosoma aerophilum]
MFVISTLSFGPTVAQHKGYSLTYDSTQKAPGSVRGSTQLIKTGIGLPLFRQSTISPIWKSVALDVTGERKLNRALSVIGGLETNFSFSREGQLYSLEMPLGLRYYFSIGKRMKSRADRHDFFSPYIAFQTHNVLFTSLSYDSPKTNIERYDRGQFLDHRTNVGRLDEAFNMLQYAYFQAGSQFKLPKNRYVDVNFIIPVSKLIYNKTELTLATPAVVNLKYGLFWQR